MPSARVSARFIASACLAIGLLAQPLKAQVNADAVNDAIANLSSGDRERVMTGRQSLLTLLNAARTNPPVLASFSRELGTSLMPVASGKDPHAKLNAALVVARAAEMSGSPGLADIIAKLTTDSSAAISAVGLRAASNVLPRLMTAGTDDPIVPAILKAVQQHADSEAVATEAYNAIVRVLNDRTAGDVLTPNGVTVATPRAVAALQQLMEARIAQFGHGTTAEPAAEQPAIGFLGRSNTWNLSTPEQRTATVRLLLSLMEASVTEMAQIPNGVATRERLAALRNLEKSAAGSLSVISQLASKPALQASAQKVKDLGLATPVNEYRDAVAQLAADFAREMPETSPATQPAGPTTGVAPAAAASAPSAR